MTALLRARELARSLFTVARDPRGGWTLTILGVITSMPQSRRAADREVERLAAPIERAVLAALAERDAGEAERTARAVAAERERIDSMRRAVVRFTTAWGPHLSDSWREHFAEAFNLIEDRGNPYRHLVLKSEEAPHG